MIELKADLSRQQIIIRKTRIVNIDEWDDIKLAGEVLVSDYAGNSCQATVISVREGHVGVLLISNTFIPAGRLE